MYPGGMVGPLGWLFCGWGLLEDVFKLSEKGKEGLLAGYSGIKRRGNPYPSHNVTLVSYFMKKIKVRGLIL